MEGNIIIADDDRSLRTVLAQALTRAGCKVKATGTLSTMWRWIESGEGEVLITDVMMPDGDSIEMIPKIKEKRPDLPIIVMSARNNIKTAMRANEFGVYQYLPKPFDLRELISNVNRAIKEKSNIYSAVNVKSRPMHLEENLPLVGSSSVMQTVYRQLSKLTNTGFNILIEGRSGTGKSLVAKVLHDFSERKNDLFLEINLSTANIDSIRNLLFGSKSDSFMDIKINPEKKEIGTLFLDEVSDTSLPVQNIILEFIKEKELRESSGKASIAENFRIISSSKVHLKESVENGSFREDLYFRLNEFSVNLPLLEERVEDIPELCAHFLKHFLKEGFEEKTLSQASIDLIKKRKWVGNVRELKNFIGRLVAISTGDEVDHKITKNELSEIAKNDVQESYSDSSEISKSLEKHISKYFQSLGGNPPAPGLYQIILKEVEVPLITSTLSHCQGNQIKAAKLLGINRNTLRKKIKDFDILVTRGKKMM